ncbi:allene oxide cyclase barrel-like domain-containing protein [Streptomyces sennicomposti]
MVLQVLSDWLTPLVATPPKTVSPEVGALKDTGRSLILRDLREKVVAYESNNPDPTGTTPTENDFATVKLEIFGPDGSQIGTTEGAGRMLYRQARDEHFIAYFGEEITLNDGNVIRAGGLVDDARLTAGEHATFPAVVVSGPLRGAIGFRQFRPLVKESHTTYESSIVVYRR